MLVPSTKQEKEAVYSLSVQATDLHFAINSTCYSKASTHVKISSGSYSVYW